MDVDDLRSILRTSDVDIWTFIETSINLASSDYGDELKYRRDGIVGKLYREMAPICWNCDSTNNNSNNEREQHHLHQQRRSGDGFEPRPSLSPLTAENGNRERERERGSVERNIDSPVSPVGEGEEDAAAVDDEEDAAAVDDEEDAAAVDDEEEHDRSSDYGIAGGIIEEKRRILNIKEQIEDPNQSEDSIAELLQSLADMDITFQALKETDIGRYVNRLRKHPSSDVRRLVKFLVRKWKDLVDEWVRLNGATQSSALIEDDSPLQNVSRNQQNGQHQVPDFGYSPNPHYGISSGSDKNNVEHEPPSRLKTAPARREPPCRTNPQNNGFSSQSAPPPNRQKEAVIDPERLASARKRLQENYQEVQNAKKQRTIQVMDIHEIPKPKNRNAFFSRNKGGFQGRHK